MQWKAGTRTKTIKTKRAGMVIRKKKLKESRKVQKLKALMHLELKESVKDY